MPTTASDIIREARHRGELTQSELGKRARVAQSVVSAYEAGRREPSVEMARKLVNAAGFELRLQLECLEQSRLRKVVDSRRDELRGALEALGASNIRLFGSVARGDDGPLSDVDLLIDIEESTGLFALGRMRSTAEQILSVAVDIVPAKGLKSDVLERALADAVPL